MRYSAHIPRLAQVRPGEPVRFVRTSTDQAVAELRAGLQPWPDRKRRMETA